MAEQSVRRIRGPSDRYINGREDYFVITKEMGSVPKFIYHNEEYEKFISNKTLKSLMVYIDNTSHYQETYKIRVDETILEYAPWNRRNNIANFVDLIIEKINRYIFYKIDDKNRSITYHNTPNISVQDILKIGLKSVRASPFLLGQIVDNIDCATHTIDSVDYIGILPILNNFDYIKKREVSSKKIVPISDSLALLKSIVYKDSNTASTRGGSRKHIYLIDAYGKQTKKKVYIIGGKEKLYVSKGKYVSIQTYKSKYLNKKSIVKKV